jgi:PAS domain S-box-containing protein
MDDGVISKTLDGFITTFNPAAETLFGYTADEVIGKHISIIIPADKLSEENDIISKIKDGHYIGNFLTERVGKDGTVISVSLTLSPIKNTTGKLIGVFTIAKNITDKIAAEKKLEQITQEVSYYKFALIESSIISITDTKGAIIFANDNFSKISKYSVNELIGQDLRIINSGYHPKEYIHSLWTTIAKGNIWRGEFKNKAKDGSYYWVNATIVPFLDGQGETYQYVVIKEDITERKQAEEELKKSDEFSRGILNSLNSYIAVLNKTGEIIKTNQAWKIMSASAEMSKANFISEGKNILDILDKTSVAGNVVAKDTIVGLRDVMNGRTSVYKNQFYFKPTASSDEWWFDIVITGFIINTDMVIINIQDITDLKNIEQERDDTQEANTKLQKIELELSNALAKEKELNELKSSFVSMASHEFRTPLTTIMSSLSLISRYAENADTESQARHINRIKISVNNLTDILTDFLTVSKLEEGKIMNDPKEINLKNFIGDIVIEMQLTVTEGINIVEKYHAKEMATIDQKLLKNIMFNLLSNAIKFSKASGIVEVIVEELEDSIVIAVKDNGIGILKEDQKNLFQRFFRGYNATNIQGTGLGLNIVAKYAELMQASLTYESIENKGSIFSLKIPQ